MKKIHIFPTLENIDERKHSHSKYRMFVLKCGVVLWEVIRMKRLIYFFTFSFRPERIIFVQDDAFMVFPFLEEK